MPGYLSSSGMFLLQFETFKSVTGSISNLILKLKEGALISPFEIHCSLDHIQTPLHQAAPFPCGHSVHEEAT